MIVSLILVAALAVWHFSTGADPNDGAFKGACVLTSLVVFRAVMKQVEKRKGRV